MKKRVAESEITFLDVLKFYLGSPDQTNPEMPQRVQAFLNYYRYITSP